MFQNNLRWFNPSCYWRIICNQSILCSISSEAPGQLGDSLTGKLHLKGGDVQLKCCQFHGHWLLVGWGLSGLSDLRFCTKDLVFIASFIKNRKWPVSTIRRVMWWFLDMFRHVFFKQVTGVRPKRNANLLVPFEDKTRLGMIGRYQACFQENNLTGA